MGLFFKRDRSEISIKADQWQREHPVHPRLQALKTRVREGYEDAKQQRQQERTAYKIAYQEARVQRARKLGAQHGSYIQPAYQPYPHNKVVHVYHYKKKKRKKQQSFHPLDFKWDALW